MKRQKKQTIQQGQYNETFKLEENAIDQEVENLVEVNLIEVMFQEELYI
jgi:hypothetical protein